MEYYSGIKNNEIMPLAALCVVILSEVSQRRTSIWYQLCEALAQMNLFTKEKQGGKQGRNWEIGINVQSIKCKIDS